MKYKIRMASGFLYRNDLRYSKAHQSLNVSARELLHCFINELRFSKRKKNKPVQYTNNDSISFTEIQFREFLGYCSTTYLNARNQLIKVGLIKQTYRGGVGYGDRATYKLLFIPGVPTAEQRWRNYPERNWSDDIPKLKKQLVGVKTQFKKGQSGRKTKATL